MNFEKVQTTELPGPNPLVVNVVVVNALQEEKEGTGLTSDIVKVDGGET